MFNVLRTGEPLKNDLKKKILVALDALYGVGSPQIIRMMKLFSNYNFNYMELLNILSSLESSSKKSLQGYNLRVDEVFKNNGICYIKEGG